MKSEYRINESDRMNILPWECRKIFWVDGFGHGSVGLLETTIFFCSTLLFCANLAQQGQIDYMDVSDVCHISWDEN